MVSLSTRLTRQTRLVLLLAVAAAIATAGRFSLVYAQPPAGPSVSWQLQTAVRTLEADASARTRDTNLSRMIKAYRAGKPSFIGLNGREVAWARETGLPTADWDTKQVEPASDLAQANRKASVQSFKTVGSKTGNSATTVVLTPVCVADNLCIGVELTVVSAAGANNSETDMDLLFAKVKLHGGSPAAPTSLKELNRDTFVDLWSQTNAKRISLAEWEQRRGAEAAAFGLPDDPAHFTINIYGPLLYDVLAVSPEFVLIGNRKIALPEQFQEGCDRLCSKVRELRAADGQPNPPRCK